MKLPKTSPGTTTSAPPSSLVNFHVVSSVSVTTGPLNERSIHSLFIATKDSRKNLSAPG